MDEPPRPDWSGRIRTLQAALSAQDLDALVISTAVNITYLTGFDGTAGLLVLTPGGAVLVTDGRYALFVEEAMATGAIAPVTLARVDRRYDLTLAELIVRGQLRRVGFEAGQVTVATAGAWRRVASAVDWVATERVVETMRLVKDAGEVVILRRAARELSGIASQLGDFVVAGRTEREVARDIDDAIERAGFSRPAFATIVASGPNSAHPHARPGPRRLSAGDLVLLDFGGVLDGYCVDLTRMAAVSPVAPEQRALYEAVRAAHAAAVAAVRPGIEASAIDTAARDVLEARGFGAAFVHSTGHGLGLEVHEAPRIARRDPELHETVEVGMVFTIEPGAYLDGIGGVRLEDDVLVTPEGGELITDASRDLLLV